jgi:peptidoglycan/xylan/chitin deacetylase (PgdA/CDA1 family)
MRPDQTLYLMYHEIEIAGRPLCYSEPGYVRYVLREQNFREQMNFLKNEKIRGLSVSQALLENHPPGIVITFDDGCETDLIVTAPILKSAGLGATFYITIGFLSKRGYVAPAQVRELGDSGFDIGCHSMTHAYLNDLDEAGLRHEIVDAKKQLEDIVGRPVHHFSCPGGRWSPAVARVAKQAGYQSVATSRIAVNGRGSDPFHLARVAVMRGTKLAAYQALCQGNGLLPLQLRDLIQSASRRVLGNNLYDRMRSVALGSAAASKPPRM